MSPQKFFHSQSIHFPWFFVAGGKLSQPVTFHFDFRAFTYIGQNYPVHHLCPEFFCQVKYHGRFSRPVDMEKPTTLLSKFLYNSGSFSFRYLPKYLSRLVFLLWPRQLI